MPVLHDPKWSMEQLLADCDGDQLVADAVVKKVNAAFPGHRVHWYPHVSEVRYDNVKMRPVGACESDYWTLRAQILADRLFLVIPHV